MPKQEQTFHYIRMARYVVVALYGSKNPDAPVFAGYLSPVGKLQPTFCVYDLERNVKLWVKCPNVDFQAFTRSVLDHGLNRCGVKFSCDVHQLSGDGTESSMKVFPSGGKIEVMRVQVSVPKAVGNPAGHLICTIHCRMCLCATMLRRSCALCLGLSMKPLLIWPTVQSSSILSQGVFQLWSAGVALAGLSMDVSW